jgi:Flp pilus assembly pilin Flp
MDSSAFLKNLAVQEAGQGLTEYSLILGFVVFGVWVLVSVGGIGEGITAIFSQVASTVVAVEQ